MRTSLSRFLAGGLLLCAWGAAEANVRLPAIISDNMVLQAEKPLAIWGWADAGEEVSVTLGDSNAQARADDKGKWQLTLPARKASATPLEMTVSGKNTIAVKNVLVGEVWGGSGQSNMQWSVQISSNAPLEIASANYPEMRLFIVPNRLASSPIDDVQAKWVVCSPQTVGPSSAVLYFFGREIHKTQNVPVGLITCAWGGSRVQPWITPAELAADTDVKRDYELYQKQHADRIEARNNHLKTLKAWLEAAEKAAAAGQEFGDAPPFPADPAATFTSPSAMYNGMVHGIQPYTLRGWLWYQGESNRGEGMYYTECMKALIASWRKLWHDEFPFLFVQLAPFHYDNNATLLPEIWEAQTATLEVPNTGMAVTTDIATIRDIHPPNKQDVGKRLAFWALAHTYGKKDLVYSGPLYESMAVEGDKIRVKFRHGAGLNTRDGKDLTWFSIAGDDKTFHKAIAKIDGDTVVVSCPAVPKPVAVRFGWNQVAEPNLANKAGLPASPFRTDRWKEATNAEP